MDSSTSLSKPRVPAFALWLLATALATWAAGALYTVRLNPELAFCRQGDRVKQAWIKKLEREQPYKIEVVGGSSCATTIIPEQMLAQYGLPVVNLGQGAGMGSKVLIRYGLETLRPGDTLIIAIEPGLLTVPLKFEPHGIQFCFAIGRPELLREV